jgi:hypothetical protein
MPGVCPECVKLVSEGDACPTCGGPLVSSSQWARDRERLLPRPPDHRAEITAAGTSDAPRGHGLYVFLGAMASVAAAIAITAIVFAVKGG